MTKSPEKGENDITDEAPREAIRTGRDVCDIRKAMLKAANAAKETDKVRRIRSCRKIPRLPQSTQARQAMSLWYAAHILMYVKRKSGSSAKIPLWENIILIKASSEEEAFTKAEQRGKLEEGDDDGTFRWEGQPAT